MYMYTNYVRKRKRERSDGGKRKERVKEELRGGRGRRGKGRNEASQRDKGGEDVCTCACA